MNAEENPRAQKCNFFVLKYSTNTIFSMINNWSYIRSKHIAIGTYFFSKLWLPDVRCRRFHLQVTARHHTARKETKLSNSPSTVEPKNGTNDECLASPRQKV